MALFCQPVIHSEPVIKPLAGLTSCFWLINSQQSWPFDSGWRHGSPENEARCQKQWFDVLACRDSSSSCWRPRTFPSLAEHVVVDEWTEFYAMLCSEKEVPRRAEWILEHSSDFTGNFFGRLSEEADLFLMHVDGWWELYTHHLAWQRQFREGFPKSYQRSWRKAGQSLNKQ